MWPLLLTLFIAAAVGLGTALAMLTLAPKQAETPSRPGIDADEGSELQAKATRVVALPFIAIALGVVIAVLGALMILIERNSYVRRWDESCRGVGRPECRRASDHCADVDHTSGRHTDAVGVGITQRGNGSRN